MPVAVHIGRVEEVAAQVEGAPNGVRGLCVVGGAVGIPERVASHRPRPETDLAHRKSRAAEGAVVHASSSLASCAGVVTGSEHVVPTHTVAAASSATVRITTLRGR